MIGIIAAEDLEVQAILKTMDSVYQKNIHDYTFYEGKIGDKKVVLLKGGIGKVNAAIGTTLLLCHYQIDGVINCGVAGGIHQDHNVGDVIIATNLIHYDVDVTAFGRELGQIPGLPTVFETDIHYKQIMEEVLETFQYRAYKGTIVSGDQFVSRQDQVDYILKNFPQAQCVEMEGASLAQVCYLMKVPFIVIRSLSDIFGKEGNKVQYDIYLEKASQISANVCKEFITKI